MPEPVDNSHYLGYLDKQKEPTKPTPKEIEWSRRRFSSRAEPPKA